MPSSIARGQSLPATEWASGAEFERQMDAFVGVRWSTNPLRVALSNLATNQRVAVFLDRRVDPDQPVDFATSQTSLRSALDQLAEQLKLGRCEINDVIYFGPTSTTEVLNTVIAIHQQELQSAPKSLRERMLRKQTLAWPALTTPRSLVERLAGQAQVDVVGWELLPHDLWPAADLPPLDLPQSMGIILAGFGLTYQFTSPFQTLQLRGLPARAVLSRRYSPREASPVKIAEVQRRYPQLAFRRDGAEFVVDATWEQHAEIRQMFSGRAAKKPPRPPAGSEVRYSLKIENQPVRGIAVALAKRLDRRIEFDPSIANQLDKRVSFEVREVRIEELLDSLLSPAGLSYQLSPTQLTILPGASD